MMIKGYAMGNNWYGYYTTSLQEAFARGWQSRPDDVSETVKLVLILGCAVRSTLPALSGISDKNSSSSGAL
jgi:hypothetical protein